MNSSKSISVLGCGWLGFELAQHLIKGGYPVKGSTTTPSKIDTLKSVGIDAYLLDISEEFGVSSFFDSDVLIINIPPGRQDPEVTTNYPNRIERALKAAKDGAIKNVILVSSSGVYASDNAIAPDWNFPNYTDQSPNAEGNSPAALIRSELLLQAYFGSKGTILRFGGLVGADRLAGKFLAGKKDVANGMATVNMIHRDDCIGIIQAIIMQEAWGKAYNATADGHPSRQKFYTAQAEKYGFEKPSFLNEKSGNGKVVSNILLKADLGYSFIHPNPMRF